MPPDLIARLEALRIRVRKGIVGIPEGEDEATVEAAIAELKKCGTIPKS